MYYAKAMYQGGMIVCADDDDVDYSSYLEDGLRCLECGEEVHLKSGSEKKPHFAHFKATSHSRCSLRVTGYSEGWSGLTPEGREQRRQLFQKYFLNILARSNDNLYQNNKIIAEKITPQILNSFTEICCNHFYDKVNFLIIECRRVSQKNYDNKLLLQMLITCEAIDYLSVPSSRNLLEQLIHYSIYKFCITINENWNNYITQVKPNEIIQNIKDILLNVSWLSIFSFQWNKFNDTIPKLLSIKETTKPKTSELTHLVQNYIYTGGVPSARFFLEKLVVKIHLRGLFINLLDARTSGYKIVTTIGHLIACHPDDISQRAVIDWAFLEENSISGNKVKSDYIKFYQELKLYIENFLKQKIKHSKSVDFNLIEGSRLQQEKERVKQDNSSMELQKKLEEKLQKQLNKFSTFSPSVMIICPHCSQEIKKSKLRKHLTESHKYLYSIPKIVLG